MNLKEFSVGYLSLMLAVSYLYQAYARPKFYPPEGLITFLSHFAQLHL